MHDFGKHIHRRGDILAGCLVVAAIIAVIVVVGGVIVAMNARAWIGDAGSAAVREAVNKSTLPEAEKTEVLAVIDQFTAEFKAGDVSYAQAAQVAEQLAESPIMPALVVMGVEDQYIGKSTLSEEEKAEGGKQLSRFVRGLFEGTVSRTKIDDVAEPISAAPDARNKVSIHASNINLELKAPEDVTTEELNAFLANAKAEADAAGVPDERFEIDWSDEIQAAIDRGLGRAPAEAPAEAEPEVDVETAPEAPADVAEVETPVEGEGGG